MRRVELDEGLCGTPCRPSVIPAKKMSWLEAVTVGFGMAKFTDAALPYPDALIVMTSLAAQWLLTRKKFESWILWIFVDMVAVAVYFSKELTLTTGLYLVFLALAVMGLIDWRKALVGQARQAAAKIRRRVELFKLCCWVRLARARQLWQRHWHTILIRSGCRSTDANTGHCISTSGA